jgi:hypothetical protein
MIQIAGKMLEDIRRFADQNQGVLYWVRSLVDSLDLKFEIELDDDFATVFPREDAKNWRAASEEQAAEVRQLAQTWARQTPSDIVRRIARFEREIAVAGRVRRHLLHYLCSQIASQVSSPVAWASELLAAECQGDLIQPFLASALAAHEPGYEGLLEKSLQSKTLRQSGVGAIVRLDDPPASLLDKTMNVLDGLEGLIDVACLRGEVREPILRRLLTHPNPMIAGAAAFGEWAYQEKKPARASLRAEWRAAIVRFPGHEHSLGTILEADGDLARDWLAARVTEGFEGWLDYGELLGPAFGALDLHARESLLDLVGPGYEMRKLVFLLVGDDLGLYRKLLQNPTLSSRHLDPLAGERGSRSVPKAKLALNAGYTPADVAHAMYDTIGIEFLCGDTSPHWAEWGASFEALCSHEDPKIAAVGKVGLAMANARRDDALRSERKEAVYGF